MWELDWEYDFPAPADWDEAARPHLELLLTTHDLLCPGGPLTQADHDRLMAMLERVGFGWLRRAAVVDELERMWAARRTARERATQPVVSDLARRLQDQSVALNEQGRREEALAAVEEAIAVGRRLAQAQPDAVLVDLAVALDHQSVVLGALGRYEPALAASVASVAVFRRMTEAQRAPAARQLATSLHNQSVAARELGRRAEAWTAIEEALAIRRRLFDAQPETDRPPRPRRVAAPPVAGAARAGASRGGVGGAAGGDGGAVGIDHGVTSQAQPSFNAPAMDPGERAA